MIERPQADEYADYYEQYVSKVPEGDVLEAMARDIVSTRELLSSIGEDKAAYRYAPDKWSIKQVVGHMIDVERLFAYRAMAFARCDKTHLPGFEQDDYVANANFDERTLADLSEELGAVRASSLAMYGSFNPEILARRGTATGLEFSVRALPYIIAGHEIHHVAVIRDRYLGDA